MDHDGLHALYDAESVEKIQEKIQMLEAGVEPLTSCPPIPLALPWPPLGHLVQLIIK